jgi:FdhE protein
MEIGQAHREILLAGLDGLVKRIARHHGGISLDTLVARVKDDAPFMETLAAALVRGDSDYFTGISGECRIGLDELFFVTMNWFKPFFIKMKEALFSDRNTDEWLEARCPFCGQAPDMAKIVEAKENRRLLHCSLCEYEWAYQRMGCVICGNQAMDTMGYYEFEGSLFRFYYCDVCSGYIKTLKVPRQNQEDLVNLAVDNIITNYLDASALSMGYRRA